MKYLQLILLVALSNFAFGQEDDFYLEGKVLDTENNPIPYASVGLLHDQIGTSTNLSGGFLLRLPMDTVINSDTLVISVLGYKSYKQPLKGLRNSIVVKLENHTYELKEIIVTDLSAAAIVAKALKLRKKNYSTKKFKTQAFFRGLVRNDSTYMMMTEAQLTITDKGYQKFGDTKLYLNELKYIDERNFDSLDVHYDTLAEVNEVDRLWKLDYMNWSFDKIDWLYSPEKAKYELDSITYFDNQPVFCISVKTKKQLFNQVFIRMDNFAIIEVHRGWRFSDANQKSTNERIGGIGSTIDGRNYRIEVVQYKKHKGKYYLSYASLASPIIGGDKQKTSRLAHENARAKDTKELNYEGVEYNGKTLDPDKNNCFDIMNYS